MEINWNAVGIVVAVVFYGMLLIKPLGIGLRELKKLPRGVLAGFLFFSVIAAVEADKPNSPPRLLMRRIMGVVPPQQEPVVPTVTQEEIVQGYRLVAETNDTEYAFSMPSNAVYVGRLHEHGARSDFGLHRLDFGDWAFPCGTNNASVFWWFMDGRIQNALRNPACTISVGLGDMLAVQGESRLWLLVDEDGRTITWERFFAGGDTNLPVNAQISLYGDGGFTTRSNDCVRVYERVDPNDWDGDGLDNTIDEHPDAYDGDMHGTGVDWLNAECGAVLTASIDSNDVLHVEWNTNSNESAYYWLSFTAQRDGTRIVVDCGQTSNLGDMIVIANSNQVCSVPLLMGPYYHVTASWPVADISASDPEAEVRLNAVQPSGLRSGNGEQGTGNGGLRSGGGGASDDFDVERSVELSFEGTAPNLELASDPDVGAVFSCFTGGCCQAEYDGASLYWACSSGCGCGGFSHDDVCATATWEGYSQTFWISQSCECQEYRKDHPETWFDMSASSVVMLHGEMGSVSAGYEPNETPSGTVTLRCTSGSGKIALWENTNRTQSVSLPMTWDASMGSGTSFYVEGVEVSDSVGDVEFEYELALAGEESITITRQMTVATVKQMNVTSTKSGSSDNEPPFMNGEEYEFSVTNSLSPDKHLVVPFHKVGTQVEGGFSVARECRRRGFPSTGASIRLCRR